MAGGSRRRSGGPAGVVLGRSGPADDGECGRIVGAAAAASIYAGRVPFARAYMTDEGPLALAGMDRIIARDGDGSALGFVQFDRARAYVKYLFVLPRAQGRGIGEALLRGAESAIAGPVELTALAVNDAGIAWYLRRGYRIVGGELEEDWHGGPAVWVRLRKGPA